jgi:tRNA threonylcarbamoyladenosine biosynthesis protein TsaE
MEKALDGILILLMSIEIHTAEDMTDFGARLGVALLGGEVIELIGDVGAGKTTLAKGIAAGLGVSEDVQSPSFTISRVYDARDELHMAHYDFYRLNDPGIMSDELQETIADDKTVTIIEWSGIVEGVLPADRLTIRIVPSSETDRQLSISAGGAQSEWVREQL